MDAVSRHDDVTPEDAPGNDSSMACVRKCPAGLRLNGEPSVEAPQDGQAERLAFYDKIRRDMGLTLLNATSIVAGTRAALTGAGRGMAGLGGLSTVTSLLRTLERTPRGVTGPCSVRFPDRPTVSVSAVGESLTGDVNQNVTLAPRRQG